MAADAAKTRTLVLRHAGAVLAVTAGFDPSTPNMARVYDYWLGGKDHYAADRAEGDRLLEIYPKLADLVRENRAFIIRAVTMAADLGIGQFIDLGAGLQPPGSWADGATMRQPPSHRPTGRGVSGERSETASRTAAGLPVRRSAAQKCVRQRRDTVTCGHDRQ